MGNGFLQSLKFIESSMNKIHCPLFLFFIQKRKYSLTANHVVIQPTNLLDKPKTPVKLKLNTNFLNHSVLNVFLKMETMQKVNSSLILQLHT